MFVISSPVGVAPRILTFGDSLTAGFTSPSAPRTPYASILSSRIGFEAVSSGVVTESVHSMPPRLGRELAASSFNSVIILGGSNDLWKGDADAIFATLLELYGIARERTQPSPGLPRLGLATMPPFYLRPIYEWLDFTGIGEKTDATRRAVNDRIRAEAARCDDAVLADLGRLTEAEPAFMAEDGIHLTPEAYRRLGGEVAGAFEAYRE